MMSNSTTFNSNHRGYIYSYMTYIHYIVPCSIQIVAQLLMKDWGRELWQDYWNFSLLILVIIEWDTTVHDFRPCSWCCMSYYSSVSMPITDLVLSSRPALSLRPGVEASVLNYYSAGKRTILGNSLLLCLKWFFLVRRNPNYCSCMVLQLVLLLCLI